jgi:protein MpaA
MINRFTRRMRRACAIASLLTIVPIVASTHSASAATCEITKALRQGSRSDQVTCLETRLAELGYKLVGPDKFFGKSTTKAVKAFQKANSLTVDGIVGPATTLALAPAKRLTPPAGVLESRVIGTSVQGRDIIAYRMGTPGGRVVLIIGVIHGDENKGALITKQLRTMSAPPGIDLWIIDSMNPDGQAAGTRQNANGVDLNRNFERNWSYIPNDGTSGQYSGEAPNDQPESQALTAFYREMRPAISITYHQDATNVGAGGVRKEISATYSKLVGLPIGVTPCSKGCTGTMGTFANWVVPGGTAFIVELPGSSKVTSDMITTHANAVMTVIAL